MEPVPTYNVAMSNYRRFRVPGGTYFFTVRDALGVELALVAEGNTATGGSALEFNTIGTSNTANGQGAVVVPPAATLEAQQQRFNAFVTEYNSERSHEALERRTPSDLYTASTRSYPIKMPSVEYDETVTVRQVRHNGEIKWKGRLIYVADILAKEPIGLSQIDDFQWELRYSFHLLGVLDERNHKINPPSPWHGQGENL